jgi:hypothetical protein
LTVPVVTSATTSANHHDGACLSLVAAASELVVVTR